jgi:dihydroorotate dehydrogenase (fumarate)
LEVRENWILWSPEAGGTAEVIESVMVGARLAMMASALLKNRTGHLDTVRADLIRWMEEHEYSSIGQMFGSMSQQNVPDPTAFERANYVKVLSSYSLRS